jgi:GT2 family glycosyltransferase
MVEIKATADSQYLDACITIKHTNKDVNDSTHPLLLISQKIVKRVIYLPPSMDKIIFSPAEHQVSFDIESLRFVKLTQRLALKLMHKKLRTYKPSISYNHSLHLWRHYSIFFKKQRKSETDFPIWIKKRESKLIKQKLHLTQSTTFTVILDISTSSDTFNTQKSLTSLCNQTYTNWKAIIIIQESDIATQRLIENQLSVDNKKNVVFFIQDNSQVKPFSNLLKESSSSYFLLMSNTVILSEYAMSVYARTIEDYDSPKLLYADDDVINKQGVRSNPRFKPQWNPDLLLSQNYIGECFVIHSSLLKNSYSTKIDSAWIYSVLIQQVFKQLKTKHIALILNHTSLEKPAISEDKNNSKIHVLNNYLSRYDAKVSHGKEKGIFRIQWPVSAPPPLVSIIIPTRDGLKILKQAINSILSLTQYSNYEILVVDNQSRQKATKNYLRELQTDKRITVLEYNKPFNYSGINNYAATKAKGQILALLNNDVEIISPHWLTEMVSHAQRPEIGCVGAMLYYADNRVQHAGVVIGLGGCAGHSHKFYKRGDRGYTNRLLCTQNYSAVTGACLVVEKSIFVQVNGLNSEVLAVAFNDVDFCLKVKASGYRNLWTPWAELYHHESISRGQDNTRKKRLRLTSEVNYMRDTWMTTSTIDPNYSKFLTRIREDFSLGL